MKTTDEATLVQRVFLTAVALSTVHYIDNTVRFSDYTGGKPTSVPRAAVPIAWLLFTVAGVAGLRYLRQGRRGLAGPLLAVFSGSGLVGVLHFTSVSPADFDWFQNTFIVLDFLAGAAVLVMAVRLARGSDVNGRGGRPSEPPTTSGRSPSGSAAR